MNRMIEKILGVIVLAVISYNCGSQPVSNSTIKKVVIIRHAEKPDKGDNLSCSGFNRALALPAVLYSKYKLPEHIFVPDVKSGKSTNRSRMYQTIVPFAIKYNLDIDTRYDADDVKDLAEDIMKIPGYVLVVWEHNNIPDIAQALGIQEKDLKWKDSDYDTIWVISFKDGKAELAVDKENIHPAVECK